MHRTALAFLLAGLLLALSAPVRAQTGGGVAAPAAQPAGETPIGEGYDRFNAAMALGIGGFKDRIVDIRVEGVPVVTQAEPESRALTFDLDLMFPLCGSALWVGTALMLASGSHHDENLSSQDSTITHGALVAKARFNLYNLQFSDLYPFAAVAGGYYAQSFMVPYNGKPLRLGAGGTGGTFIFGLQRRDGGFASLAYHRYKLDQFDVELSGTPLTVTGSVEGAGVALTAGFRWF